MSISSNDSSSSGGSDQEGSHYEKLAAVSAAHSPIFIDDMTMTTKLSI